ncbi:DUF1367 family protein, partial [Salmonella enterica]|uniref:DUF1367 family protein n=1 Tax=Salmonella enterica TaxID=28901 RepID=UPI00398C3FCB
MSLCLSFDADRACGTFEAGHCDASHVPNYRARKPPRRISFSSMVAVEFQQLAKPARDSLWRSVLSLTLSTLPVSANAAPPPIRFAGGSCFITCRSS